MAKKKSQRRSAPPGVDPNEKRRQRLEARRAAKAEALAAQAKRERRERIVRWLSIGALLALVVWFFFLRTATPTEINGHPIENFSLAGAGEHSGPFVYEETPPVSGPHDQVLPCGIYGEQIPDARQVHMLEHGAVGIQYDPTLPTADIRALEAVANEYDSHVFTAPYEGLDPPIALTSWGHALRLDEVEEDTVTQFIDEFRAGGDAPESYQDCSMEVDSSFEPPSEVSPTPVPTAEVSIPPSENGGDGDGGGGNGGAGNGGGGNNDGGNDEG